MTLKRQPERSHLFKTINFVTLVILALIFLINTMIIKAQSQAQLEATESAIPEEEIKENLKERLEKAVTQLSFQEKTNRAWVGTLESIANHTLTIETKTGAKLASVSAETTYVRSPKRTAITLEDLELGSYTIAMGNLNGNQVLNATRVVVDSEEPQAQNRKAQFATIIEFDEDSSTLSVQIENETLTFEISDDTEITKAIESEIIGSQTEDILPNIQAVIITKTEVEDDVTTTTLLKLHLLSSTQTLETETLEEPTTGATTSKE